VFSDSFFDRLRTDDEFNLAPIIDPKPHISEHDRALPLLEQAIRIAEDVLGFDHPNTKVVQENLRSLREKMGN
jgi:hypothetical protein